MIAPIPIGVAHARPRNRLLEMWRRVYRWKGAAYALLALLCHVVRTIPLLLSLRRPWLRPDPPVMDGLPRPPPTLIVSTARLTNLLCERKSSDTHLVYCGVL